MDNGQAGANVLVYDIGSTYTKTAAFFLNPRQTELTFLGRGQHPTTLENVMEGAGRARQAVLDQGIAIHEDARYYATCSAAGGLRMVALGFMPRVTAKAAKEVAMTAGARVMEVISWDEPPEYREEVLREIRPDIILLAGGTDGGDQDSPRENADIIIRVKSRAMVIVACNKDAQAAVAARLSEAGISHVRVPNIMPTIHELTIKPAREAIHAQFIKQIVKAKGLDDFQSMLADKTVMPTPGAVLLAGELFARGTHEQEGIGGLLLIDIGGATTDVHSALPELEALKPEERGLVINNEKQFSYRTVEGNLGLRVSATGVPEAVGPPAIIRDLEDQEPPVTPEELAGYTARLEQNPNTVPASPREAAIDRALAASAMVIALRRHAGHLIKDPDPVMGVAAGTPVGRDLRKVDRVLAVGGIFLHTDPPQRRKILDKAFADPGISLLPRSPGFAFDEQYVLFAMGALSAHYPEAVFSYLKKHISFSEKGT
ncbi:MAG: glutamate mutase L [Treponema sp.]|jgi:uncharacterized protein (TIGR01319 family)|nr:glutamate mutase L [Treponema sp.]